MKRYITELVMLLAFSSLLTTASGKGKVTFDVSVHDFGAILEKGGNVSHTFSFTNTGDEPVILNDVVSSCGCTTPQWTKNPVLPGQKGSVTATFNPLGRPGTVNKSLAVKSNADPDIATLLITGEVVERALSLDEEYPVAIGKNLRLKSSDIAFARLAKNEAKTTSLAIYNSGTEPIQLTFDKLPEHLSIKVEPATILPQQKAAITCTYQAAKKSDWGFTTDIIKLKVSGKKSANGKLKLSATILDDFSKMTSQEQAKAPYPQFKTTSQAFNNTLKGALINTSFVLTNSGQSSMTIRKVSSENAAVSASSSKTIVKPGESVEVKVTVNTATFDVGAFAAPVSVYTNSPRNPQVNLMVTGSIIEN